MNDEQKSVEDYQLDTVKALAEVAKAEYQRECWRQEVIERKAVNLLGFSGVMATINASIGAFLLGQDILRCEYIGLFKILFFASVVSLAVSAIISLTVIRLEKYAAMIIDKIVTEENMKEDEQRTYVNMALAYTDMTKKDEIKNNQKGDRLKVSFYALSIGLVLFMLEVLAMILGTL